MPEHEPAIPEPTATVASSTVLLRAGDERTAPVAEPAVEADRPKRRRLGISYWFAVVWLALVGVVCVLAPVLPFVEDTQVADFGVDPAAGPSADHWMGVDQNGFDLFSRVVQGGRLSLLIALSVLVLGLIGGGFFGITAGYFRGRYDRVVSAAVDVLLAFPALVLALAMVSVFAEGEATRGGPARVEVTLPIVIGSLSILSVAPLARVTRAATLSFAEREFVVASRTLGARHGRILRREILPNVIPPMSSFALTVVAAVIVAEGALAFLGLSVSSPDVTWGRLIETGRQQLETHGHISLFPAGVMFLTILALNIVGDVLQGRSRVREGAL